MRNRVEGKAMLEWTDGTTTLSGRSMTGQKLKNSAPWPVSRLACSLAWWFYRRDNPFYSMVAPIVWVDALLEAGS